MSDRLTELLREAAPLEDGVPYAAVERAARARRRRRSSVAVAGLVVAVAAVVVPLAMTGTATDHVATLRPALPPTATGVTLDGVTVPLPAGWTAGPSGGCRFGEPYTVSIGSTDVSCPRTRPEDPDAPAIVLYPGGPLAVSGAALSSGPCSGDGVSVHGASAVLTSCGAGGLPRELSFEAYAVSVGIYGLDAATVERIVASVAVSPRPLVEPPTGAAASTVHRSTSHGASEPFDARLSPEASSRVLADIRTLRPIGSAPPSDCTLVDTLSLTVTGGPSYAIGAGQRCGWLTDGGGTLYAVTPELLGELLAAFPDGQP